MLIFNTRYFTYCHLEQAHDVVRPKSFYRDQLESFKCIDRLRATRKNDNGTAPV
jgi:hypothetical protein